MTWMPYYPIWSLTYVAVAVLALYALTRYGSRDPAPALIQARSVPGSHLGLVTAGGRR